MLCGLGKAPLTPEEKKARQANKRIEQGIETEKKQIAYKILLLVCVDSN